MPDREASRKPLTRPLDRNGKTISAIVWELTRPPMPRDPEILTVSRGADLNWYLFPSTVSVDLLREWADRMMQSDHLIIGVDSDDLVARRTRALSERLEALGRSSCDAVILQDVDTDSLKAGRPFHRLSQLREAALTEHVFLDSQNAEVAEWMTENTPAHAVAVPYDLADQTARYRLFDVAHEMGTKLLARRTTRAKLDINPSTDESLAFRLGDAHVTAAIEPLPENPAAMPHSLVAAMDPASEQQRDEWWRKFQEKVPPPPKPKRGHPPEYGS